MVSAPQGSAGRAGPGLGGAAGCPAREALLGRASSGEGVQLDVAEAPVTGVAVAGEFEANSGEFSQTFLSRAEVPGPAAEGGAPLSNPLKR